jgi:hypothetical protein
MQDTCELSRDRDDRAQHARPFGNPQAPGAQCRPFPDPQQKGCGRFIQRRPNRNVALLKRNLGHVDHGVGVPSLQVAPTIARSVRDRLS